MAVAVNSQDTLARLLAQENIIIEHKPVSTASFDPKARVLTLPIWKDMTKDILTLLCAHETAHALYSPTLDEVPSDLSKSWVNVVEDARIEKLIKRKFPGLATNFFRGYKELFTRNFFETEGRELSSYSLIDRINLHFKNVPLVPFSEEEQPFVQMVSECETFDDVLDAVRAIRGYAEENEQDFEDIEFDNFEFSDEGSPVEFQQAQQKPEDPEKQKKEGETAVGEQSEEDEKDQQEQENVQTTGIKSHSDRSELDESETDTAWMKNQENLLDEACRNYVYLNIPDIDFDEIIVDWKTYNSAITRELPGVIEYLNKFSRITEDNIYNDYYQFKNSSIKSVNYLVKEFEMRKSADEYRRTSIAKTGVIDTNVLYSYKWNEDIFKKLNVVPGAKNHGMIFFLDWSGSMDYCLRATVKQLYNLIWFCTKVQIPFEVYSFCELEGHIHPFGNRVPVERKDGDIAIVNGIRMCQLFTSKMKSIQLEDQMKKLWLLAHRMYAFSNQFSLGGTPLNEAIICAKTISERFLAKNNVQKLNLVFLTDGESNFLNRWIDHPMTRYKGNYISVGLGGYYSEPGDKYILRDNYRTYELDRFCNFKQTQALLEWLKDNISAKVIGFRIANDREANQYAYKIGSILWDDVKSEWKKNRSITVKNGGGYDEMYVIRNDQNLGADTKDIEFEADASKAQIKKAFINHMKSKTFNKVILNRFIGAIA